MILHHIQKSHYQFIVFHGNDLVYILLNIWENMISRTLYCGSVGYGIYGRKCHHFAFLQGSLHTVGAGRFHANHFDVGIQQFYKSGDSCGQTASPDRNQDIIYQWKFFYNLHSNGSLTGSNCRIIKRMDKGIAVLFGQLVSMVTSLVIHISIKDYFRPIALSPFHFYQRCGSRHNNYCFYSKCFCSIGNPLGMISC